MPTPICRRPSRSLWSNNGTIRCWISRWLRGVRAARGGCNRSCPPSAWRRPSGENVIIANGTMPNVLDRILGGEEIGTLFLAEGKTVPAWKRWIGYTVRPKGRLLLDEGACRAIAERGRSLLAIGITDVEGEFIKGELVSLVDASGQEIARGLTNYPARDLGCKFAGNAPKTSPPF